ncbi:hypothetical protein K0M31_015422 [Melipona bicolor]|uniref:Uncharacterized protein n=1 Tax=Melipona bicolor TaxID=60889 RepID=A0AA40FFA9_9HYME|nr:hypothetical protein K0M31_015422 [Melipona bicolor]
MPAGVRVKRGEKTREPGISQGVKNSRGASLIFVFIFRRSTPIDLGDRVDPSVEKKTTNSGREGLALFPSFYGKLKLGIETLLIEDLWTKKKRENKIETKVRKSWAPWLKCDLSLTTKPNDPTLIVEDLRTEFDQPR